MRDGIRHQHPNLDDEGVLAMLRDADFVIRLDQARITQFAVALPADLHLEQQAGFEAVTGTTRSLVTLRHTRARPVSRCLHGDGRGHDHHELRWASAARRTKDRDDVRNIIAVRGDELDWDYIERWCTTHGTLALLVEIRASLPPG